MRRSRTKGDGKKMPVRDFYQRKSEGTHTTDMGCGGSKGAAWSSVVKQPILSATITVENPSPAKSVGKNVADAPQEALTSLIRVESVSADDAATQDGKDLDAAAVKIQAIARGKSERQKQKELKATQL